LLLFTIISVGMEEGLLLIERGNGCYRSGVSESLVADCGVRR